MNRERRRRRGEKACELGQPGESGGRAGWSGLSVALGGSVRERPGPAFTPLTAFTPLPEVFVEHLE